MTRIIHIQIDDSQAPPATSCQGRDSASMGGLSPGTACPAGSAANRVVVATT